MFVDSTTARMHEIQSLVKSMPLLSATWINILKFSCVGYQDMILACEKDR